MAGWYGRAGRLTAENGGFRPGQTWSGPRAGKLSHLANKSSHLEGKLSHLEGKLSHFEGKPSHLEGKMSHLEGKLSHFEGKLLHFEGKLTRSGPRAARRCLSTPTPTPSPSRRCAQLLYNRRHCIRIIRIGSLYSSSSPRAGAPTGQRLAPCL